MATKRDRRSKTAAQQQAASSRASRECTADSLYVLKLADQLVPEVFRDRWGSNVLRISPA